jgi:hypothetical protein
VTNKKKKKTSISKKASDNHFIGSANCPPEGSDAGPDEDFRDDYVRSMVSQHHSRAAQQFAYAKRIFGSLPVESNKAARRAIEESAKAFWWANEGPLEETQHEFVHEIGRWTRSNFGCPVPYRDGYYHQTCPASLIHLRAGLSIGSTSVLRCSICGEDLSECFHVRGRTYWIRGGQSTPNGCSICRKKSCDHREDHLYRARVIAIVISGKIHEISIVRRPANPSARFMDLPLGTEGLKDAIGEKFEPGMPLSCDKCILPCMGFRDFEASEIELSADTADPYVIHPDDVPEVASIFEDGARVFRTET